MYPYSGKDLKNLNIRLYGPFRAIKYEHNPIIQRRNSSVSEGAWKSSLRNNWHHEREKLLPAIPNPSARQRTPADRRSRARSAERIPQRMGGGMRGARVRNASDGSKFDESEESDERSTQSPPRSQSPDAFSPPKSGRNQPMRRSTPASERRRRRKSNAGGNNSDNNKDRGFGEYSRKHKLDRHLTEELFHDIVSQNPGVGWKDIAGECTVLVPSIRSC